MGSGIVVIAAVVMASVLFVVNGKWKVSRSAAVEKEEDKILPSAFSSGSRGLPDYDVYKLSGREKIIYTAAAALFLFGVAYVFYHSIILSAFFTLPALFYPKIKSKEIAVKRKYELNQQFKDALYSLASSLSAGKSIELAFKDVQKDISLLYPDPETCIIRELTAINRKIEMNETVESALADFARRAGIEDIKNFADVFAIGKRSGGNMTEIIKNTSAVIGDKLRIKEEINTLLAQRKLEQRILNIMPVLMILLLSWSTGDYMKPVFNTAVGRTMMTIAVLLLAAAFIISKKITDIEV